MTPDALYKMGYADGVNYVPSNARYAHDENYEMGYTDGRGDAEGGVKATGTASPFIVDGAYLQPPPGYIFTGEHRTPQKGEVYLTKNGNAGVAKDDPKNGRQRHMLMADISCRNYSYGTNVCQFADGHKGLCSYRQVKP